SACEQARFAQGGEKPGARQAAELGTMKVAQQENERGALKKLGDAKGSAMFVAERDLERKPGAGSLSIGNRAEVRRQGRMRERGEGEQRQDEGQAFQELMHEPSPLIRRQWAWFRSEGRAGRELALRRRASREF